MKRFLVGENVLVQKMMGQDCVPAQCGVVQRIYGPSSSLFDYMIRVGNRSFPVRDEWLIPPEITIHEAFELSEL